MLWLEGDIYAKEGKKLYNPQSEKQQAAVDFLLF